MIKVTKRAMQGLDESIEEYEKKIKLATNNECFETGREGCPLCQLFNNSDYIAKNDCHLCPIALKTNRGYCEDTPYGALHEKYYKNDVSYRDCLPELNAMLEWLIELRKECMVE